MLLASEINAYAVSAGIGSDPLRFLVRASELKILDEAVFKAQVKFSAGQWDAIAKALENESSNIPKLLFFLSKAYELDRAAIAARIQIDARGWQNIVDYITELKRKSDQSYAYLIAAAQAAQPKGMEPDIWFTNDDFDNLLEELFSILHDRQTEYLERLNKFVSAVADVKYLKITEKK